MFAALLSGDGTLDHHWPVDELPAVDVGTAHDRRRGRRRTLRHRLSRWRCPPRARRRAEAVDRDLGGRLPERRPWMRHVCWRASATRMSSPSTAGKSSTAESASGASSSKAARSIRSCASTDRLRARNARNWRQPVSGARPVHRAGLIHGDVKAQNVMREAGGRIVLMDFGTGHDQSEIPARPGDLSGTPLYLAPEVFAGGAASIASDVYALAVLLFHVTTAGYPVPPDARWRTSVSVINEAVARSPGTATRPPLGAGCRYRTRARC